MAGLVEGFSLPHIYVANLFRPFYPLKPVQSNGYFYLSSSDLGLFASLSKLCLAPLR
jgi:hypothetical protein